MSRSAGWLRWFAAPRSNCFLFAWWLYFWGWSRRPYLRRLGRGYCAIRPVRSPLRVGWHWVYVPPGKRLRTVHIEPADRARSFWTAAIHKVWFRYRVRHRDTKWSD